MPGASFRQEPEGQWRGFDAFDVIDPGTASFALEELLDDRRDDCRGSIKALTDTLDAAHDRFEAGDAAGGVSGLRDFKRQVEELRDHGQLPNGFASDLLTLAEVAIEWAGQAPSAEDAWPEPWVDEPTDDQLV